MIPVVKPNEAQSFAKVWNYNGVAIVLDDVHFKFAADFANVVLRSFIQQQMSMAAQNAKPKVTIVEE